MAVAALAAAMALPAAASAATGAISGTVTEANGGLGVVDARVCAETESGGFGFECTLTGIGGSYEIIGLTPAEYTVWFDAGESGKNLIRQFWQGVGRYEEATKVTVSSGSTTPSIDAALLEGGAIAGKVTAASTGAPLANVEVCSRSESSGEFDACGFTASNGIYEVLGVPTGLHELEFWSEDGEYEPAFLHGISVSVGTTTGNANAALVHVAPAEGRISGHVYAAATHAPLAGVSVCGIWAKTGETGGCAVTGASGAYLFVQVPPGALKIAFSPEPAEVDFNKNARSDIWPTQFWNSQPTLAQANVLTVTSTSNFTGIDGLLGPGPAPVAPPVPFVASKPKPLKCPKGKVKRRVKGKVSCVRKRHHHRHHRRHHHPHH